MEVSRRYLSSAGILPPSLFILLPLPLRLSIQIILPLLLLPNPVFTLAPLQNVPAGFLLDHALGLDAANLFLRLEHFHPFSRRLRLKHQQLLHLVKSEELSVIFDKPLVGYQAVHGISLPLQKTNFAGDSMMAIRRPLLVKRLQNLAALHEKRQRFGQSHMLGENFCLG